VSAVVRERGFTSAEPTVALTLALPVLRGDHDEEVVEAVTQLGVSRIVPFTSARSVVRSLSEAKRRRWERIAREAAETARRGRVPTIDPARDRGDRGRRARDGRCRLSGGAAVAVVLAVALPLRVVPGDER
ncbi:MAG: RsmE family RNA methyltransferase, partial [Chloroflexi bacterium]